MTYLLDTMIVTYFIQANHRDELAAAAACCPMVIVDEVRRELERDRRHGGAFKKWLPTSKLGVRAIEVGSDASNTLARLRNPASPDKDLGERASIALASTDAELTFVTHDLGAIRIALRELWMPGERMLGLHVFLRRLVDATALRDPAVLDEIMKPVASEAKPTWWASFRAGLASS